MPNFSELFLLEMLNILSKEMMKKKGPDELRTNDVTFMLLTQLDGWLHIDALHCFLLFRWRSCGRKGRRFKRRSEPLPRSMKLPLKSSSMRASSRFVIAKLGLRVIA